MPVLTETDQIPSAADLKISARETIPRPQLIQLCNRLQSLRGILRELNLRGTVSSLSEPPLMSREGLVGREPVLEIGDAYWSLRPGETISKEACLKLLSRIVQEKG